VSRRILVALLTLIIAVVAGAMVPVAMNAVNQDRTSFIGDEEAAVAVSPRHDQASRIDFSVRCHQQFTIRRLAH